jgi:hypothetical protein
LLQHLTPLFHHQSSFVRISFYICVHLRQWRTKLRNLTRISGNYLVQHQAALGLAWKLLSSNYRLTQVNASLKSTGEIFNFLWEHQLPAIPNLPFLSPPHRLLFEVGKQMFSDLSPSEHCYLAFLLVHQGEIVYLMHFSIGIVIFV